MLWHWLITHQVRVGSQDTVAAAWEVSDWSRASDSAPADRLWSGSWLMLHWAWKCCKSKNDVRSLLYYYSWIHCVHCWSGWRGQIAGSRRQSRGSSWWGSGAGRAATLLYRCAPECGPTSAGSWPRKVTVLRRPATTALAWLDACTYPDGHVDNTSCY